MSNSKQSIYEYVKSAIDPENGKLQSNKEQLPDYDSFFNNFPFGFISGAFEGIMSSWKTTALREIRKAWKVIHFVQRFAENPSDKNIESMCNLLREQSSTHYLENVMRGLKIPNDKVPSFYSESKKLLLKSPDRNVVKYALYFMSFGNIMDDMNIILTLAKHDEFTVHAVHSVLLGANDPNKTIFEIAKSVDGWGKISTVENLEPDNSEICNWLLCFGCQNNIMNNYLAYICAEKGKLLEALSADHIDSALFAGAGIILYALVDDFGPAENIEDYNDGCKAIGLYLIHANTMSDTIDDLLCITAISSLLTRANLLSREMAEKGWTPIIIDEYKSICGKILSNDKWATLVWLCIKSEDRILSGKGRDAARKLGIDIWEDIFESLKAQPMECIYYYELASTEDISRLAKLVHFAEVNLPLNDISTGPGNEMGLGIEFEAQGCLDAILQSLQNKEGIGTSLIETALWSKVVRNRNMAISVLETWEIQYWTDGIMNQLKALMKIEPDKLLKKRIKNLMKKRMY